MSILLVVAMGLNGFSVGIRAGSSIAARNGVRGSLIW